MSLRLACLCFGFLLMPSKLLADQHALFDMETIRHHPGEVTKGESKIPIGTLELVDGRFNKAVRFSFAAGLGAGFMTASVRGGPDWDQAGGFGFYVKGDGSINFAGVELIDRDEYFMRACV